MVGSTLPLATRISPNLTRHLAARRFAVVRRRRVQFLHVCLCCLPFPSCSARVRPRPPPFLPVGLRTTPATLLRGNPA